MSTINLNGPLIGDIEMPGDKSMTHRAMIFASLAKGSSQIFKPLLGEDCLRTLDIFRLLGVTFDISDEVIRVTSPGYEAFTTPHQVLYTGNSGTTTRLLAGLFCGLGIESVLSGDASIGRRPMDRVMQPLTAMGANIHGIDDNYTPLIIKPAPLIGMTHHMTVASAQVKSAILFASLFTDAPTHVIEKERTRNHTETMFEHYHIPITVDGDRITVPEAAITHIQPEDFDVPGDISSAAFFIVAALITPGSDITLHHIGINATRSGIIDVVKEMHGDMTLFNITDGPEPTASIRVRYTENLRPANISGELIPRLIDEIPIIALLCTQADGTSIIKDAAELKVKETNRIDTTVNELNKLGFDLTATDDGMRIEPSVLRNVQPVDSHEDHRIGMMLAVASLQTRDTITIKHFDCVNISFPGFVSKMDQLQK